MADQTEAGALEDRADAGPGPKGQVRLWLQAIDLASREEKDWREDAELAYKRFTAESASGDSADSVARSRFNILFANVQTLTPAVYNSTPIPDVRRRFADSASEDDEVAKTAAQVLERALSFNIDDYDFNGVMKGVVKNGLLQGRGLPRVRYIPTFNADQTEVVAEELRTELVEWDSFRHGPASSWDKLTWVAFRHRLTRDELTDRFGADKAGDVNLDWQMDHATLDEKDQAPDIFKRATVWEIWDKEKRQVVFIAKSNAKAPLKTEDDPLNLSDFWPVPKPFYDIQNPDTLVPQSPYEVYRSQAEELDNLTMRIRHLISVLIWRGVRAGDLKEFDKLKNAVDGELVPLEGVQQWLDRGGLQGAIWLMPIQELITVIRELIAQREVVKQTVFELTGVADIMRGQSNPNETLGAQRIKTEFGTLRLQERQTEIQRVARDLMRIKAEIIAEHFSIDTLESMTGIELARQQPDFSDLLGGLFGELGSTIPQQQPQQQQGVTWEAVMDMLRSDTLRSYNVDIETDSTIRGDLGYFQENAAQFVQGFAQFIGAVGPAVQAGAMPKDVATDLLLAFSRQFKLGRQAEDALERMGSEEQQQQIDPAQIAAQQAQQQEAQAQQQEAAMEQQKMALEQQKADQDSQLKAEQGALDARQVTIKEAEVQSKIQNDQQLLVIKQQELELKARELSIKEQETLAKIQDAETKTQQLAFERGELANTSQQTIASARTIEQIARDFREVKGTIDEIQSQLKAPKSVNVKRDRNSRPVGATVTQGGVETEVVLNG